MVLILTYSLNQYNCIPPYEDAISRVILVNHLDDLFCNPARIYYLRLGLNGLRCRFKVLVTKTLKLRLGGYVPCGGTGRTIFQIVLYPSIILER